MGYMKAHAILVDSWDVKLLKKAHRKARAIFPHVSAIVPHVINGGAGFYVPPDGSKEGWGHSQEGDARRDTFIEWINKQGYDDGSSSLRYAEVTFAEDNDRAAVERHN